MVMPIQIFNFHIYDKELSVHGIAAVLLIRNIFKSLKGILYSYMIGGFEISSFHYRCM